MPERPRPQTIRLKFQVSAANYEELVTKADEMAMLLLGGDVTPDDYWMDPIEAVVYGNNFSGTAAVMSANVTVVYPYETF